MTPILGIIASQISGHLTPAATLAYESIATVNVGSGGTTTITFSSIPSTYKHLQIRFIANNVSNSDVKAQFNGDIASNYARHYVYGDGASAAAGANPSDSAMSFGYVPNATANIFGAGIVDILDYANTNKYKTTRSLAGNDKNGSGLMVLYSSLWQSTSAVSSITMFPGAGNFNQYSSFALYGIKG
jgi:hypothetical protein